MRIGALIHCTRTKKINPPPGIRPSFDIEREGYYRSMLPRVKAYEMYRGPEFKATVGLLRSLGLGEESLFILSARYGLIRGDFEVVPYDARITPSNVGWVVEHWLGSGMANSGLQHLLSSRFDVFVVRLSRPYMLALGTLADRLNVSFCVGDRIVVYSPIQGPFTKCPGTLHIRVRGHGDYVRRVRALREELSTAYGG